MKRLVIGLVVVLGVTCGMGSWAADFDGDSRDDIAVFRPAAGLWAIRGVTRLYLGGSGDEPVAGDYDGDGIADIAIFRGTTGVWAVRGITRTYFGGNNDTPISGGGGQRLYDYVVQPGAAADLVQALESDTLDSVFVPAGDYNVSEIINVDNVKQISSGYLGATFNFETGGYLSIEVPNCHVERIKVNGGGDPGGGIGNFYIQAQYASIVDCRSINSLDDGFQISSAGEYASFVNCIGIGPEGSSFSADPGLFGTRFTNCLAETDGGDSHAGFKGCHNLTSCVVEGGFGDYYNGFEDCYNLAACKSKSPYKNSFATCARVSACSSLGYISGVAFNNCSNLSSCHTDGHGYSSCWKLDTDSCD
jgi:hypothetical protein